MAESLNDPGVVLQFLDRVPDYAGRLATYTQDGNTKLTRALDEWLDKAAAGVL